MKTGKLLKYLNASFFYKKSFYEKMTFKNPKTLREC